MSERKAQRPSVLLCRAPPPSAASAHVRMSERLLPGQYYPHNTIQKGPDPPRLVPGDALPDGVVLMKSWLSFEEQMRIVETIRNLGMKEGGFYTPFHEGKPQLRYKMMCLGWVTLYDMLLSLHRLVLFSQHWNPVNKDYEKIRSNHDGALVPPLPDFLKDLTLRCLSNANRLCKHPFAKTDPNSGICNFYTHSSYLGLHQVLTHSEVSLLILHPTLLCRIEARDSRASVDSFLSSLSRSVPPESSLSVRVGRWRLPNRFCSNQAMP